MNADRFRDTREEAVFRSGYDGRYAPYAGIENGQFAFDWLNEPSTESSCGVGAELQNDNSIRAVVAAPIRSKLCVSRSDLRSLFPADCLDKKRVKRRFQVPRRFLIAASLRGL